MALEYSISQMTFKWSYPRAIYSRYTVLLPDISRYTFSLHFFRCNFFVAIVSLHFFHGTFFVGLFPLYCYFLDTLFITLSPLLHFFHYTKFDTFCATNFDFFAGTTVLLRIFGTFSLAIFFASYIVIRSHLYHMVNFNAITWFRTLHNKTLHDLKDRLLHAKCTRNENKLSHAPWERLRGAKSTSSGTVICDIILSWNIALDSLS